MLFFCFFFCAFFDFLGGQALRLASCGQGCGVLTSLDVNMILIDSQAACAVHEDICGRDTHSSCPLEASYATVA